MSDASRAEAHVAWLRFTLAPKLHPARQRALLDAFGSPMEALGASVETLSRVVPLDVAEGLARGPAPEVLSRALRWLDAPDHHLVTFADEGYPALLREAGGAPPLLYVVGDIARLSVPSVAIVGSRNATRQGLQDAQAFARALSECGLAIVSGLAVGIDTAAHRGGLAGPGSSIAVLGTGADILYPRRNAELCAELARRGALVTEFPLGTPPTRENFPQRNRIISGLARGVLVVEAATASGSLITARFACSQNREVFAIPGSIHSPLSRGCHEMIKAGAKLVECADDILEELRLEARTAQRDRPVDEECADRDLLEAMGHGPVSVDELARALSRGAAEIIARLSVLEIDGVVACSAGGRFQRVAERVIE